jgi:WD40 repeat protein
MSDFIQDKMDKFYQDAIKDNFYTDAEISLIDSNDNYPLLIKVHKCILGCSSTFFHKLFDYGKNQSMFVVQVDNKKIARDVIFSHCYNQQMDSALYRENKNLFDMFKCKNQFCLKNDIKFLYDIKVLPEEFYLFVEIIKNIGLINDEHLIKTIKENIPLNYDLNNSTAEFVNKFIDTIEIILIDPSGTLNIVAHKCVLESSAPYFHGLFHFNENTNQKKQFEIEVNNTKVARDMISTFYNQEIDSALYRNIKYLSDMFECRRALCLNNDIKLLYDIDVPKEDFELFMQVIDSFTQTIKDFDLVNDKRLMRAIKKNIQLDYDLNNFTIEFINELLLVDYQIVLGGAGKDIQIWDTYTNQLLNTLKGHNNTVSSLTFSSDNSTIISASHDGSIKIWNTQTGQLLNTFNAHNNWINCIALSSDNLKIVSGSADKSIKMWNAKSGQLLNTFSPDMRVNGHTGWVNSVAFSSDGSKFISGSGDASIKIWDTQTGQLLNTFPPNKRVNGHRNRINSVAFSSDNLRIVSGSHDNTVKIWDTNSGLLLNTLDSHTGSVQSVAFSPDNLRIVSAGNYDGSINIWDAKSGQLLNTWIGDTCQIYNVTFSSNNLKIISSSYVRTKIWDAQTYQLLNTLANRMTHTVAFSHPTTNPIDAILREHTKKLNQEIKPIIYHQ